MFSWLFVSIGSYQGTDDMQSDEVRRVYTGRGFCGFSPWIHPNYAYSLVQLYLGSNPLSNIEIVSALNSFNIAYGIYYYFYGDRPEKYNPKLYFGTIQSVAKQWNFDQQNPEKIHPFWVSDGLQKSGSYYLYFKT